jgi:Subtilase family
MTTLERHKTAPICLALAAGLCLAWAGPACAGSLVQAQPAEYEVQPACAPPSFGYAGCLALRIVRRSAASNSAAFERAGSNSTRVSPLAAPSPAHGEVGYTPEELHTAYELPTTAPASPSQTIALVDAFNDPTAAADLKAYSEEFGLPECGSGCFTQYNESGETTNLPFPKTTSELESALAGGRSKKEEAKRAEGWGLEISLDIETAHAICHNCHIALVEAKSTSDLDLEAAERAAAKLGATEISNSWGGPECIEAPARACVEETQAFNHPGIVITASAGDDGYLNWAAKASAERGFASYPASSPNVVSVGGTRLETSGSGAWESETVWNDGGESAGVLDGHGAGGGGCSVVFTAQPWQQNVADWSSVGCGTDRAVADVSADADPYTGIAVRYSRPECEFEYIEAGKVKRLPDWCTIGGTSLASPLIASVFALAGGAGGVEYPARTLYQNEKLRPAALHDVNATATSGSNGKCSQPFDEEDALTGCTPEQEAQTSCSLQLVCLAHAGYDGPTGVGTPHGIEAFKPPSAEEAKELIAIEAAEETLRAEEQRQLEREQREAEERSRSTGSSGTSGPSAGPSPAGAVPATQTTPTAASSPTVVRISALALTPKALLALNHSRPKLSQVGFTFTINAAARVSVALAKRVRVRGHTRWTLVRRAATIAALDGRNVRDLSSSGTLGAGAYRLTLTPVHGVGQSLVFKLG